MHSKVMWAVVCSGIIAAAGSAARANLLVNGGLESGISTPIPPNFVNVTPVTNQTALTGWTIVSGSIDITPNSYWQSSEGNYSVDMVGTPGVGSISQKVSNLTAQTAYTLTFDMSANPEKPFYIDETGTTKMLQVQALAADGVTVLSSQIFSLTNGTRTFTNMQYVHDTFSFTTTGTAATILLTALTPGSLPSGATPSNIYTGPVIDNLNLTAGGSTDAPPAPEPASLALMGLGGMLLLRRRKNRA